MKIICAPVVTNISRIQFPTTVAQLKLLIGNVLPSVLLLFYQLICGSIFHACIKTVSSCQNFSYHSLSMHNVDTLTVVTMLVNILTLLVKAVLPVQVVLAIVQMDCVVSLLYICEQKLYICITMQYCVMQTSFLNYCTM